LTKAALRPAPNLPLIRLFLAGGRKQFASPGRRRSWPVRCRKSQLVASCRAGRSPFRTSPLHVPEPGRWQTGSDWSPDPAISHSRRRDLRRGPACCGA